MQICNTYRQSCKTYKSNLFTQITAQEDLTLPENMPDIDQIISCVIDPEILSVRTINTVNGISYEGQQLTGKKAVIEFRLTQKLLYAADHNTQSIHVLKNEYFQSTYIVIPYKIEGTDPGLLIRNKYLKPEIYIEDIYYGQTGKRNVFISISITIQLVLIPSYEICCSTNNSCSGSSLILMQEDGQNASPMMEDTAYKNIRPKWSPGGNEIAFLSDRDGKWMLYLYSLKNCNIKRITDPEVYKSITGFTWTADGKNLCFTAVQKAEKDIYITDIISLCTKRLTYGEGIFKNYSPKCSPDGTRIAFLKSYADITDLWLMNTDGTNSRKVSEYGTVTNFDWSPDSGQLAFFSCDKGYQDTLYLTDIDSYNPKSVSNCDQINRKRKVLYSPDQNYLAFIGSDADCDNIYLYDLKQCRLKNITRYTAGMKISSFVWKIDGTKIYYAVNDLFHYNLYSVSVEEGVKTQLTFTTASDMELDYRPRIF